MRTTTYSELFAACFRDTWSLWYTKYTSINFIHDRSSKFIHRARWLYSSGEHKNQLMSHNEVWASFLFSMDEPKFGFNGTDDWIWEETSYLSDVLLSISLVSNSMVDRVTVGAGNLTKNPAGRPAGRQCAGPGTRGQVVRDQSNTLPAVRRKRYLHCYKS